VRAEGTPFFLRDFGGGGRRVDPADLEDNAYHRFRQNRPQDAPDLLPAPLEKLPLKTGVEHLVCQGGLEVDPEDEIPLLHEFMDLPAEVHRDGTAESEVRDGQVAEAFVAFLPVDPCRNGDILQVESLGCEERRLSDPDRRDRRSRRRNRMPDFLRHPVPVSGRASSRIGCSPGCEDHGVDGFSAASEDDPADSPRFPVGGEIPDLFAEAEQNSGIPGIPDEGVAYVGGDPRPREDALSALDDRRDASCGEETANILRAE